MKFTIFTAATVGNEANCIYGAESVVMDAESLKKAVCRDYVCARYKNNYRGNENFIMSDCLPFDFDNDHSENPAEWITIDTIKEYFPNVSFAIHYSRSHNRQKGRYSPRPRFHLFFPVKAINDIKEYQALKREVFSYFPFVDGNALDAARFFYGTEVPEVEIHGGKFTLQEYLAQSDFDGDMRQGKYGDGKIAEGSRNSTMSRIAGKLIVRYGASQESYQKFLDAAERCEPPLDGEELNKIWRSAARFGKRVSEQEGYISPEDYGKSLKPDDYSDLGQAKVFSAKFANELVYTDSTEYMRYDGTRWAESKQAAIGACEEFLEEQYAEAGGMLEKAENALIASGISPSDIKAGGKTLEKLITLQSAKAYKEYLIALTYHKFVLKRRDMRYIESAVKAAKPMLLASILDFDADEFMLNTPSGTVDLRTGDVKAHDPADYITKITGVSMSYENTVIWQAALLEFFCGDEELIAYVQRIVGLTAIGKVYVEALIIAYGDGSNGKSTFWNTIAKVLGSYSGMISADMLTMGCRRNVKPEMAELKGKRLIIAAELEEGMRLNTSIVKQLCSTDAVEAEKKYKDPFHYIPTHTMVLYTNHLPKVGASDAGTWRRLIIIPFNSKITGNADIKNYADYLITNAGGAILRWIVDGARLVITENYKLSLPKVVQDAVGSYRDDNDWFSMFLDECCEVAPYYRQKSGELYQEYRAYCIRSGEYIRSTTDFYTVLAHAGFERKKTKAGIYVNGIRIKSDFLG